MNHKWKFFTAGGFDQVKLETGADLASLDELDQKLWVALACPTTGVEFDTKTLQWIDADNDGRVRAGEVIAAAKWAASLLKNPDELVKPGAALPLAAINDGLPEGAAILASAKHILAQLGKPAAAAINLEDVTDTAHIFAATNFNGDGIVPAEAAGDDATQSVINDILTLSGAEMDRSGKPGVSQAKADAFFAAAQAYSDWWKQAESDPQILPLGAATPAAAEAWRAVKAKVDDYFARCRLAAFDPRALPALNHQESDYIALCQKDLSANAAELAGFPLAQVAAGQPLPLVAGVNPAWSAPLAAFHAAAVRPLLGGLTVLTEADWAAITAKFAPYDAWLAAKTGALVEPLGLPRVREILAGGAPAAINALIVKDKSLEAEANAIASVEKLLRFYLHLHELCVNFVNFKDFYGRTRPAIFQAGTLYLDQRSCDLCLAVGDAAKHAAMAGLAGAFLAYCDCVRKGAAEKLTIVAVFSQGDDDNLMVGRNGIFYDRAGRDYDATITKIIANPISLRQAFWSPYTKLVRLIEEQVAKRATDAETKVNTDLQSTAAAPAAATKTKFDPSVVALFSVALGSFAAAFATVMAFLGKFAFWQLPFLLIGILLLVSVPSVILAFIKLRKRNLGPILDANGWAVNAKAKISVPLGASLTSIAKLPPGSSVDLAGDKFAQRTSQWPKFLATVFLIVWIVDFLNETGWLSRLSDGLVGESPAMVKQREEERKNPGSNTNSPTTNAPAAK